MEFDRPLLYLFGGKGPLVARDLLQFPMSLPDDGYVDIVVQERVRTTTPLWSGCGEWLTRERAGHPQGDAQGDGRRRGREDVLDGLGRCPPPSVAFSRVSDSCVQQHYFKAVAYRVEPHKHDSCLSVDGEGYPFEPFEVEVHKGLATLLSPYGVYNVKFSVPDTRKST